MRLSVFRTPLLQDEETGSGEELTLLATYTFEDIGYYVHDVIGEMENTSPPKVSLFFELTRSHILKLNKAELKTDET